MFFICQRLRQTTWFQPPNGFLLLASRFFPPNIKTPDNAHTWRLFSLMNPRNVWHSTRVPQTKYTHWWHWELLSVKRMGAPHFVAFSGACSFKRSYFHSIGSAAKQKANVKFISVKFCLALKNKTYTLQPGITHCFTSQNKYLRRLVQIIHDTTTLNTADMFLLQQPECPQ